MSDSTECYEPNKEEIYLMKMHDASNENALNLHTYFYWKDFQSCPICNEWLIMRTNPRLTK